MERKGEVNLYSEDEYEDGRGDNRERWSRREEFKGPEGKDIGAESGPQ